MANFSIPEKLMACLAPLPDSIKGKILFEIYNMFGSGVQPDMDGWSGEERSLWAFAMQMLSGVMRRRGIPSIPPPPRNTPEEEEARRVEASDASRLAYINAETQALPRPYNTSLWTCRGADGSKHTVFGVPRWVVTDALASAQPSLHRRIRHARPEEYPCQLPFELYMYHALPKDRAVALAVLPDLKANPGICERIESLSHDKC